ncbi:MAG TPA: KTSC domain-containing protein [Pseudomonadales bacterium]
MPVMHGVDSSSIRAVGYDPERRRLYIRFADSAHLYAYRDVPPDVYVDLMQAASKGAYVNTQVKPHYDYTTMEPST